MAGVQGRPFLEAEVARIKHLLSETEMSISEIATRMCCSKASIVSINRRFSIRHYNGKRTCWQMGPSPATEAMQPADRSSADDATNSKLTAPYRVSPAYSAAASAGTD